MDVRQEAARLREAAERGPLKLPVNRRIDESHRAVTEAGLEVWFTLQLTPSRRIWEALFERADPPPGDGEVAEWLAALLPGREPVEAPGAPGAAARRFEVFEPR